jgi:DNA-binding CsgD family transcriptional regulator/tetratricopeptide (TPR) repeat protein
VGRDRELGQVRRWLSAAEGGRGGTLILQGDAGIGKTRLVSEIVGVAEARDMVVRASEGVQFDQTRPFGAICDALRITPRSADPALAGLARRIDGHRVWSGRLEDVPVEVHSLVEAVVGVFESLCTTAQLLMVIDNLHWADSSSLAVLRRLTRLCRQYPALVVATTRPTDRQAVLALLDAVHQDGGALLELGPLDAESVLLLSGQLAGGPPGPRLADRVVQASGNPLFVVELLTTLAQQRHISITQAGQAEIEDGGAAAGLAVSILRRLSLLPADSIELLRAAAICGRTVDLAELSMLTGRDTLALAGSLGAAGRAGIIETRGDTLWFRHELIHDALYQDWPLPLRRALHRELGERLAVAGEPAWRVARQLSLGAEAGDVDAAGWVHRAGLEAAPRDPAAAVTLLERAGELAPAGTTIRDVIHADLSVALAWAGQAGDSERLAATLVAETLDIDVRGRAASWLASSVLVRGRPHESRELCRRARASGVGSENVEILLRLLEEIASIAMGNRGGALDRMRQLLAAATTLGDTALRSLCLGGLALTEANEGHLDAAAAYGAAAVRATESARTPQAFMANSHVMHAWILEEQDRLTEALETVKRLRKVAGGRFETPTVAQIERWRARAHFAVGRWDEAVVDLDSALTVYDTGADLWPEPLALRALIAVHRGQLDTGRADLDCYDAAVAAGGPVLVLDQPALARAFLLEADGQAAKAAEVLAAAWEIAEAAPLAMAKPTIGPHLARLAVDAGDLATAHRVRSALDVLAAANPAVARLQAAARWATGIAKADAAILVEAAHVQQGAARPFDLAMVQEDAAAALARDGRLDPARDLLNQALACYERLLAQQRSASARARLRALGVRLGATGRRRRPASGWEALTSAELQVVELVAARLSNTEIAEQLFVSRRTVETHVSHALAKLGFTSRRELITAVLQRHAAKDP